MSTPVRGAEGPLGYAPRWARISGAAPDDAGPAGRATRSLAARQELEPQSDLPPPRIVMPPRESSSVRDSAPVRESVSRDTLPPRVSASHHDAKSSRPPVVAPDTAVVQESTTESFWRRKKQPPVFEGDAAMRDLRARLALAPDQMPEPPLYQAKPAIFAVVARLVGVMILAAGGALGFLWITAPHAAPPDGQAANQPAGEIALVSYRSTEPSRPTPAPQNIRVDRAATAPANDAGWAAANFSRDLTDGIGSPPGALAPRTSVSATPRAPAPRVSAPAAIPAPAPAAAVPAPAPAAVPVSRPPAPAVAAAPIQAMAPPPATAAAPADRDEVAALLTRARTYLSAGDVAAARLVLRRAAERDDAQAALALGGTYDPAVLKRLGIINFHSDPAQARDWYRRAAELGSADASLRLEQLVQTER